MAIGWDHIYGLFHSRVNFWGSGLNNSTRLYLYSFQLLYVSQRQLSLAFFQKMVTSVRWRRRVKIATHRAIAMVSTYLKNMIVKLDHFHRDRGKNDKNI